MVLSDYFPLLPYIFKVVCNFTLERHKVEIHNIFLCIKLLIVLANEKNHYNFYFQNYINIMTFKVTLKFNSALFTLTEFN